MPRNSHPSWEFSSDKIVLGVDEVGVGPIAGPVAAGAVILQEGAPLQLLGVRDSKKMKAHQHAAASIRIRRQCRHWYVGWCSTELSDRLGPNTARIRLMTHCVETVLQMYGKSHEDLTIVVDGNLELPELGLPHITLIKGDSRCLEVACASILAKHLRDERMEELHGFFPNYRWNENRGYPTPDHKRRVEEFGMSVFHRRKIVSRMLRKASARS